MSINAIEVLAARLKNRVHKPIDWDAEFPSYAEDHYNAAETQALVDRYLNVPEYPPPVDLDGYAVTPATGVALEH